MNRRITLSKNSYIKAIFAFLLLLTLNTCKQDDDMLLPVVFTGPVADVNSSGAVFQGIFSGGNISNIDDHGFVWDTHDRPEIGSSNFKSLGSVRADKFSAEISFALQTGKIYHVRAYYKRGKTILYGHSVSFASLGSLAPVITSLNPEKATWGDTISIQGKNFSYKNADLTIRFGNHISSVASATDSLLRVIVPGELDTIISDVSLNLFGNQAFSDQKFALLPPDIDNVNILSAYYKSEIVILGKYFKKDKTRVYFDDQEASIIEIKPDRIVCQVPFSEKSTDASLSVDVLGQTNTFQEKFRVLVPQIARLSANEGTWRDTIILYGQYFPVKSSDISVFFDNQTVKPFFASEDSLMITIDDHLLQGNYKPSLSFRDEEILSETNFRFREHRIISFDPTMATFSDVITIESENHHPQKERNYVRIGQNVAAILNVSHNQVSVRVPDRISLAESIIRLSIDGNDAYSDIPFRLLPPVIDSFAPANFTIRNEVCIYGHGFGPDGGSTVALRSHLGSYKTNISSGSSTHLCFTIPFRPYISIPTGEYTIRVINGDISIDSENKLNFYYPFTYMPNIPLYKKQSPFSFSINGRLFFGRGYTEDLQRYVFERSTDFWEFDPVTNTYSRKKDIPIPIGPYSAYFSTSTKGYVLYAKRLFQYDPDSDEWTEMAPFPGKARLYQTGFSIDDMGYVGTGYSGIIGTSYTNEFYSYNESDNTWEYIGEIPFSTYPIDAVGFSIYGMGYIMTGYEWNDDEYFSFDPSTRQWTPFYPEDKLTYRTAASAVVLDNKAYIFGGFTPHEYYGSVMMFDPDKNSFSRVAEMNYNISGGTGFTDGKNIYVGFGTDSENTLLKFDPGKLPQGLK
jgi:hypothetical protein